jgi:small subunit ribosomal protein S17
MTEQAQTPGKKGQRTLTGRVVSSKMDKTVAVAVERVVQHPMFGKFMRRTTKLLAHDDSNACQEGDLVAIVECRPMSKRKAWRVAEVLQRAKGQ